MSAVREKTKEELFDDLVVALRELEALRAKWDAIPWVALQMAVSLSFMAPVPDKSYSLDAQIWLEQNAPKKAGR